MPRVKKRPYKRKNIPRFERMKRVDLFLISLFVFLGCYLLTQIYFSFIHPLPVVESTETEQKTVPADVLRNLRSLPAYKTITVPVLLYHYVENVTDLNDTFRESMNVPPVVFDAQMKTLKDARYTFIFARELGQVLDGTRVLPRKPILITFDDGHRDVETDILPILSKYHVKATAYIIPGFSGGSDFMTEDQVRTLIRSRLIEIGSHTSHHIALQGMPKLVVEQEIRESKKTLEETYHIRVVSFAYPNGSFDQQAVDVVNATGYTTAVSTLPGQKLNQANRLFISRIRPGRRIGDDLLRHIELSQ